MRSITPKKYAISLYEALRHADKAHLPALLKSFITLLVKNQDMHKADKIIKAFAAYSDVQEKRVEVSVHSAHPLSQAARQSVIDQLEKSLDRDITMHEEVDPSLIGGLVLEYNDVVVDGSIKKRIELLAENLRS